MNLTFKSIMTAHVILVYAFIKIYNLYDYLHLIGKNLPKKFQKTKQMIDCIYSMYPEELKKKI